MVGSYQWSVGYYISSHGENPIDDFLNSLSPSQQSKVLRIFNYCKVYGISSILPHTKKLKGSPFWEIRILGRDNIRVIYVVPMEKIILVLHGFIKKKQKTPKKDLEIANSRYIDWKKRHAI